MELEGPGLIAAVVASVVGISLLAMLYSKRRMSKGWKGRVTKVRSYQERQRDLEGRDSALIQEFFVIRCRTDSGRSVRLKMSQTQFSGVYPDGLKPGDRVEKVPGEWWPKKIV